MLKLHTKKVYCSFKLSGDDRPGRGGDAKSDDVLDSRCDCENAN